MLQGKGTDEPVDDTNRVHQADISTTEVSQAAKGTQKPPEPWQAYDLQAG